MMQFSTRDISEATGLTVRQVQYYSEKNVVRAKKEKAGKSFNYKYDEDDVIRFMIVFELVKFSDSNENMHQLISNYFRDIKEKPEVKDYLNDKKFLDGEHFYLWYESTKKGEYPVYGFLVESDGESFPSCYFKLKGNRFKGFNLEPDNLSLMLIDMGGIYKKRRSFLEEYKKMKDRAVVPKKKVKKEFGVKY